MLEYLAEACAEALTEALRDKRVAGRYIVQADKIDEDFRPNMQEGSACFHDRP